MLTDSLGNPVNLHEASSLEALNDFVEGVIRCEARAVNVLRIAAHDPSPLLQAYCAALHMFAETPAAPGLARPFITTALQQLETGAAKNDTTPREKTFVAAIAAWVQGDIPRAILLHQALARSHPRDLVSVKLGQYHLFNRGESAAMLRLALCAHPAAADVPQLHGMTAFGYEQCHQLQSAEDSARKAMALCTSAGTRAGAGAGHDPWAHHALAHVLLTQGRHQEGSDFLAAMSPSWRGLNSFMQTHNGWHQALFAIELGQLDVALKLHDEQVWGVVKTYSQDQVNAISLLSRLELAGMDGLDLDARWADVAGFVETRTNDQVLPFLDLHYLYALARAGRAQADVLLHNLQAHAQAMHELAPCWQQVCLPAAHGLLAHARGDFKRSQEQLAHALPRLEEIGGSHAQRDWFVRLHGDAKLRQKR